MHTSEIKSCMFNQGLKQAQPSYVKKCFFSLLTAWVFDLPNQILLISWGKHGTQIYCFYSNVGHFEYRTIIIEHPSTCWPQVTPTLIALRQLCALTESLVPPLFWENLTAENVPLCCWLGHVPNRATPPAIYGCCDSVWVLAAPICSDAMDVTCYQNWTASRDTGREEKAQSKERGLFFFLNSSDLLIWISLPLS